MVSVKEDRGHQSIAAEESAAVVVDIEAEIHSSTEGMRPAAPRHIVDELRRGNRALGMRRDAVWEVDVE